MDDMTMKSKLNGKKFYSLVKNDGVYSKKFHTEEIRAEINTEKLEGIKFKKWKNAYKFTQVKGQFRYFHDGRESNPTELLSFLPDDGSTIKKKDKNTVDILLGDPISETDYCMEVYQDNCYRSLNEFHLIELKSLLEGNGFDCLLKIGMLNYKNKVYICRKDNTIVLEGAYCTEYYKIRSLVYEYLDIKSNC